MIRRPMGTMCNALQLGLADTAVAVESVKSQRMSCTAIRLKFSKHTVNVVFPDRLLPTVESYLKIVDHNIISSMGKVDRRPSTR